MTKEEFKKRWSLNYSDTAPISYLFKCEHPDRWFRIHSLPNAQRYAHNNREWEILLTRQNEIVTDLLGLDAKVLLVTGEFNCGDENDIHITDKEEVLKVYSFTLLDHIDLFKLDSGQYDKTDIYKPAFAETIWQLNKHDKLLAAIANDSLSAFFVSFDKNIIAAPYDGGVDIVLKDNSTKDFYKNKYRQWLSEREDGL